MSGYPGAGNSARCERGDSYPSQSTKSEALQHRAELIESRIQLNSQQVSNQALHSALLPTLDAYAYYGGYGLGGSQNPTNLCGPNGPPFGCSPAGSVPPTGYGSTLNQLVNSTQPDKGVGLQLNIPIRNRVSQATQIRSMAKFSAASVTHASMTATARTHHAQAKQQSAALRTPAMLAILGRVKAAGPGVNKHWDMPMGDPSSFYVDLNGSLQLNGSNTGTTMKVAGRADSAVLHNSFTLVSVDGTADSPLSEPLRVSLNLKILGNSWKPLDNTAVNVLEVSSSMTNSVHWSKEYPFSIAGVPMSVEFGVRGDSGVRWYVGLAPVSVTGTITPFSHNEAYAQIAAVDIEVAEAGVEGVVDLLHDDFIISGYVQLQLDAQQKPYIYQEYSAINAMNALDGKLRLYTCVTVPNVPDVWNTHDECTYDKIWDWAGFHQFDYIFKETKKDSL